MWEDEGRRAVLPDLADEDAYAAVYRDAAVWLPAMRVICARHGLDAGALEPAPPGSHLVFWAGSDRLIKLFCRFWPDDAVSERVALTALTGNPAIPTPQVIAEGELEGWLYLILEPLPGTPLNQVWEQVEARDREALCETLGGVMAALHAVPTKGMEAIAVDWPAWLAERRAGFAAAQTERGATPEWIAAALDYLDEMWAEVVQGRPVLLNADITDEHVLLAQEDGRWRMTGLIDFGDAMLGDALYEFTAPLAFIVQADVPLRRALCRGYGHLDAALNVGFFRKLAAMALLHQFADLPLYVKAAGDPPPPDFAALRQALWSAPGA
jgi:hygromycin-B 7''-O-kinase